MSVVVGDLPGCRRLLGAEHRRAGDGCDPLCRIENIFACDPTGQCGPVCGDGITLWVAGEECDDGNLVSGDGCSAACTTETGFVCTDFDIPAPPTITVPVTVRDFRGYDETGTGDGYISGGGHPDFERYACNYETTGLVLSTLGGDSKPVYGGSRRGTGGCGFATSANQLTNAGAFDQWYRSVDQVNRTAAKSLTLVQTGTNQYEFDSRYRRPNGTCCDAGCCAEPCTERCAGYFPVDNELYGNYGRAHNFGFTSEMRAYFKYNGGEYLRFSGDDDVWVFINGRRAVDLGGLHPRREGSVTLSNTVDPAIGIKRDTRFDIFEGGIYEIALFHAERHTTASNYWLTLTGFVNTGTAACAAQCGDGYIRGNEECDDGDTAAGDGCSSTCTIEPGWDCTSEPSTCVQVICGNGVTEFPETCDDHNTAAGDGCSPTCTLELCGDGDLDAGEECDDHNTVGTDACTSACKDAVCGDRYVRTGVEECDDGNSNNLDNCTTLCQRPYCGDGIVQLQNDEKCDDGVNDGSYGSCTWDCRNHAPYCGDSTVQPQNGEECDDGAAENTGDYGICNGNCTRAAYCGDYVTDDGHEDCDDGPSGSEVCTAACRLPSVCGDGIHNPVAGEQCDDGGGNDGHYGGCMGNCTLAPRCGDVLVQSSNGEECDRGPSGNTGGYNGCKSDCKWDIRCGDGIVQTEHDETCDDTVNDNSYGGCFSDCTRAPYCGDEITNGPEQCDLGEGNNLGGYNGCDTDCTWPPRCGDGVVQAEYNETCDDTVNNGGYGTCKSDCTRAPYCGDSVVQSGDGETCDNGVNDGSYGTCRPSCRLAAYCGDGIVQSVAGGEQCDGSAFAGRTCSDLDGDGYPEPGDFSGGTLACAADCRLDATACYRCGDGVKNGLEVCDGIGRCSPSGPADCGDLQCEDLGFPTTTGLACTASCTFDLAGCNATTCGNRRIDGSEACDDPDLGGKSCVDLDGDGSPGPGIFTGGALTCALDCTLDVSDCEYCGDGVKNGGELCDGHDTGTETCESRDYIGGALACNATCDGFDESGCYLCETCEDCGGQACIDHRCGDCRTTADCCAPYVCFLGSCRLF